MTCPCRRVRDDWIPSPIGMEFGIVEIHIGVVENVRFFKRVFRRIEHTTSCVDLVYGSVACDPDHSPTNKDVPSSQDEP